MIRSRFLKKAAFEGEAFCWLGRLKRLKLKYVELVEWV